MKLQEKFVYLSVLLASFGLSACDDDSSDSCGLTEESCQSLNKTLDVDNCICVDKNDNPYGSLCPTGKHVFGNTCEDDSLQNCGQHDNTCSLAVAGWKSGTCTEGQCVATECRDGYHPYQNNCELNEVSACGSHDNDCTVTQTGWKTGVCNNGTCQALSCIENMHVSGLSA